MKNEVFITDDCIIEDEAYLAVKDSIKCGLCKKILKEPIICKKCQNNYCKFCIDKWKLINKTCPNKCQEPDYDKSADKPFILSMLKFICRNCKEEIKYNDRESHLKSGCKTNRNLSKLYDVIYKKKKLKKLTMDDVERVKKEGYDINHISSKKKILYIIINNSNNSWKT